MSNVVDIRTRAERDQRPLEERLVSEGKLCVRCRADKPKTEFTRNKRNRDGCGSYCKACSSEVATAYNKKKREQADWADRLLINARVSYGSGKRRKRVLSWEPMNLTREFLLDLYRYQDGKCAYFNIPMLTECDGTNLQAVSLDRLDCERGYVQGNVVLASRAANLARNNASVDDMHVLVEMIKRS